MVISKYSPNPNLTWEKTSGVNVGVDFGSLKIASPVQ
jgi:hypothetical protein